MPALYAANRCGTESNALPKTLQSSVLSPIAGAFAQSSGGQSGQTANYP